MAEIALAIRSIEDLNRVATMMVNSGFFSDLKTIDQACVKIMAGQEMGIPPVASVRGIYIVRGQVSTSSQIMASLIKKSGRYDYKVIETTSEQCTIRFFEDGEECGESTYSMDDAKVAKLTGNDTWQKHPKMMLFNRAMSNGAKMYCPNIFHGSPYVVGELDDPIVDEDARDIPDMTGSKTVGNKDMDSGKDATKILPTEDQVNELCDHLKRLGVREGDEYRLVEFVSRRVPLTADECKEIILSMENADTIPAQWFGSYISMLLEDNPYKDKSSMRSYWREHFGTAKTGDLPSEQQKEVIEWATTVVHPNGDVYTPGDSAEAEAEAEANPWLVAMTRIQNETGESIEQIEAWLLKTWGQGTYHAVEDMPVAWIEAVEKMSVSDIKTSMSGLTLV